MLDFMASNIVQSIIAFALVLIPAIFIHELGHFLAGKAAGITILEFGIGFPPRILTLFRRGETEYTLNWLPIGGFVRPLGEDFVRPTGGEAVERDRQDLYARLNNRSDLEAKGIKTKSVNEATPLQRILFMAGGSAANLLTALLVFVLIGVLGVPTVVGASVGLVAVDADSPFAAAGLQAGDLLQQVNGSYFNSLDELTTQLSTIDAETVTLTVLTAESDDAIEVEVEAAALSDWAAQVFIAGVSEGSPAADAGLQAEDLIVAFNGEAFTSFDDLPERTQANLGDTVTLTILRQGETLDVELIPRANPPEGEGSIGIGIFSAYGSGGLSMVELGRQQAMISLSPLEAIQYGSQRIGNFVQVLVSLPGELMAGNVAPEEARVISPLGISQLGSLFLQRSIETNQPVVILDFIAIISVALGITNLLPLPALDGGRIMFVLLEIIRGRPIAPEREGLVHLVGMVLLLSLMAIALINDVMNPITALP